MKECLQACRELKVSCPVEDCRLWINYEQDLKCTLESISKNDEMTLREVGDRLGLSYVRVKQIQDNVLNKITDKF